MSHSHTSNPNVINRLKRANGHLIKIIEMINEERSCLEIAQQLQAVQSAVGNAKTVLIHDHIEGCIENSNEADVTDTKSKIQELKEITKYL